MFRFVCVMVHMFDQDPMPEEELNWHKSGKLLINRWKTKNWPTIWHFDSYPIENHKPHSDIPAINTSWSVTSTSIQQTVDLISETPAEIVIVGGLHKDQCVKNMRRTLQETDHNTNREYYLSEYLSLDRRVCQDAQFLSTENRKLSVLSSSKSYDTYYKPTQE